jgi:hypothetical protein
VTLVGGVTALLAGRALWCLQTLIRRPELGAYASLIVAAAAAGNADIWRYLVFLLPVVTILFGRFVRQYRPTATLLGAALVFTVLTQEPLVRMTLETYFRDWFPYYRVRDSDIDQRYPHRGTFPEGAGDRREANLLIQRSRRDGRAGGSRGSRHVRAAGGRAARC